MYVTNDKTDKIQRSILGTILLEPRSFFDVSDILQPVMFSGWLAALAHEVWDQMEDGKDLAINTLAVDVEARHQVQQSSVYDLIQFANPGGLIRDAEKLRSEYHRQQEINIHSTALEKLQKGIDPEQVVADSQADRDLIYDFSSDENKTRASRINDWFDRILKARDSDLPVGIQTPFSGINNIFGGLHRTNYNILAGRPGMGKTTLLLDILYHAVKSGVPALFFSMEMSYYEILSLLAQKATGILNKDMRAGKVTDKDVDKIQKFMAEFYELPIFIETGTFHIADLKHKTRLYARKYGIELVGIDYLQLMSIRDFRGSRNSEIEQISRGLKSLASERDCNVCLIALSQLSRAVEARGGTKRPQMSDLRDSGSLEQDADNIMFTYRPDYYDITEDVEGKSLKRVVEVIITKNRHVSDGCGSVMLTYDPIHNRLHNKAEDIEILDLIEHDNVIPLKARRVNDEEEIPF